MATAKSSSRRDASFPIPVPLTSLVGREDETRHIRALLRREDVRLLTLTGPGGVGKTRLALAVAKSVSSDGAGGVIFLPFAPVNDQGLVATVLARALGVQDVATSAFIDQIRAVAAETEALLLIDNFEHLLPAAPLLSDLLAVCPRVKMLVTSRERLRLSGERVVPVHPLPVPDPDARSAAEVASVPAVRLFVERAQAVSPDFILTDANAPTIAAICHRLDGLPLALELAAARSPHLTPSALLTRLTSRLPLLTGGPRDAPLRLQTMRAAIAWSHDLLTSEEQLLFRRLAVFAGGFTLEAAEAVWAEGGRRKADDDVSSAFRPPPSALVVDGIASLVDKSLVRRVDQPSPRLEMLETIREVASEALIASEDEHGTCVAHADFYLALAETGSEIEWGARDTARFDRLDVEHANLRAALAWLFDVGPADTALRLAVSLGGFWLRRGHHLEGSIWLDRLLAATEDGHEPLRAAASNLLGDLLRDLGEPIESRRSFEQALRLARTAEDRHTEATALFGLSSLADDVGDNDRSKALCQACIEIWRELGDRRGLGLALHNLAWAEAGIGNIATALSLLDEALQHSRAVGDDRMAAHILNSLGNLAMEQGDLATARPLLEECLALTRALRDRPKIAEYTGDLGWLCLELGDLNAARLYLGESLMVLHGSGQRRTAVFALEGYAVLAAIEGEPARAEQLVAATMSVRSVIGLPTNNDPRLASRNGSAARRILDGIAATSRPTRAWSIDEALLDALATVIVPHTSDELRTVQPVLSPRELDVLRQVVAGQPDRAIADTLFISRRTASKHVSAILAKLGVSSRAEAAARAVRDGLV